MVKKKKKSGTLHFHLCHNNGNPTPYPKNEWHTHSETSTILLKCVSKLKWEEPTLLIIIQLKGNGLIIGYCPVVP